MTPEETELLSELTIIMPSYNRPFELERAIEYWRDTPVRVHILDGSEKPWFPLGLIEDSSSVTYHHIPAKKDQEPQDSVFQRIVFGSKLAVTKFSAVGCDDDFYSITQLASSLRYLEEHSAISAVCGRVLTYQKVNQNKVVWWCKYLNWRDQESAKSSEVSVRAFGKKNWFLYAVCRTEIWSEYLKLCYTSALFSKDQFYAHEWLMKQLSSAMFKTKFFESIATIRQSTQYGVNLPDKVSWRNWLSDADFKLQVDGLVQQLALGISRAGSSDSESRKIARRLIDVEICELGAASEKKVVETRWVRRLLSVISKMIPDLGKNFVAMFMPADQALRSKAYSMRFIKLLLTRSGISFDESELDRVQRLLLMPREELRLRANI